jgi:hypothetical protein
LREWVAVENDRWILLSKNTRWFKYDRDYLCVNKSQFVPVIFEPPCIKGSLTDISIIVRWKILFRHIDFSDDGRSRVFRNVGTHIPDYVASPLQKTVTFKSVIILCNCGLTNIRLYQLVLEVRIILKRGLSGRRRGLELN